MCPNIDELVVRVEETAEDVAVGRAVQAVPCAEMDVVTQVLRNIFDASYVGPTFFLPLLFCLQKIWLVFELIMITRVLSHPQIAIPVVSRHLNPRATRSCTLLIAQHATHHCLVSLRPRHHGLMHVGPPPEINKLLIEESALSPRLCQLLFLILLPLIDRGALDDFLVDYLAL